GPGPREGPGPYVRVLVLIRNLVLDLVLVLARSATLDEIERVVGDRVAVGDRLRIGERGVEERPDFRWFDPTQAGVRVAGLLPHRGQDHVRVVSDPDVLGTASEL